MHIPCTLPALHLLRITSPPSPSTNFVALFSLKCVAVCLNVLQRVAACCSVLQFGLKCACFYNGRIYLVGRVGSCAKARRKNSTATHCDTLRQTATHCDTLQYTAPHCNMLHLCAKLCEGAKRKFPFMKKVRHGNMLPHRKRLKHVTRMNETLCCSV